MKLYRMRTTRTGGLHTMRIAIGVAVLAIMAAVWVAFASPAGAQAEVVVCNEAIGTLVEVSQEAIDLGSLDFPYHLATDAEIAAGECAVAAPGAPDEEPTVVLCDELNGKLVELPEWIAEGAVDFPSHLATDAEIAAGECAATASEEAQPDTIGLGIRKFNCPSAAAATVLEAGEATCDPGARVTFEVATADGDSLGTCTTEISVVRTAEVAICYVVDVPFETPLVITEDVSTGPAGFVPLSNPQTMTIQRPAPDAQDFAPIVTFVNVPAETGSGDNNGGEGGPVVVDPVSCGHFETQADAQAYFDTYELDDPSVLDPDGDGYACEFRFGEVNPSGTGTNETSETSQPIALPNTGAGTIVGGDRSNRVIAVTLLLMSGMAVGLQRRLAR